MMSTCFVKPMALDSKRNQSKETWQQSKIEAVTSQLI